MTHILEKAGETIMVAWIVLAVGSKICFELLSGLTRLAHSRAP